MRSPHQRAAGACALLVSTILAAACGSPARWNVLLVTFDTTRADHLHCYGFDRIRTPTLDGLAADGVLFEHAYSTVPITLPSHTSIMTGLYPPGHGVRDNGIFVVPSERDTLAERLARHGYRTAAAIGSYPLISKFGLDQGFELFDDDLDRQYEDFRGRKTRDRVAGLFFDERKAQRVNEAVYGWLDDHRADPFFLWVHYYDPHQPNDPPPPYDQLYADDLYSGEIAYADESLGTLLDDLRRLGVWERTLVVFTADHGEGLGDHREMTHSYLAYDSTLHIPLIVRQPGGAGGRRVTQRVSHVDIVPTVLDLLGFEVPAELQGRSLVPLLGGEPPSRDTVPVYAETLSPRLAHGWGELRVLMEGDWKYIHGPRPELYDLPEDPGESHDLSAEHPEVAQRMEEELQRFLTAHTGAEGSVTQAPDPEVRRRLEALGYVTGTAGEAVTIREVLTRQGIPPQDRVEHVSDISRIKDYLSRGEALAARSIAARLVAEDPDSPYYLELQAQTETMLGNFDRATEIIEHIQAVSGGSPGAARILGHIGRELLRAGDLGAAGNALERAAELDPTADGLFTASLVAAQLGDAAARRDDLERAVEIDPTHGPARVGLAILEAQAGDPHGAEESFRAALSENPYYARGQYNYGAFLLERGRPREAVERFRRAVELEPAYAAAYYAAGVAYQQLGDRQQALAMAAALDERDAVQAQRLRDLLQSEGAS